MGCVVEYCKGAPGLGRTYARCVSGIGIVTDSVADMLWCLVFEFVVRKRETESLREIVQAQVGGQESESRLELRR